MFMKEIKVWWEKAKSDLAAAKNNIESENYDIASFLAHQSMEKALKALQIKKKKQFTKTHDLLYLGKEVGIPEELLKKCCFINPVYTETRYPDASGTFKEYSKQEAENDVNNAEEVVTWIEKQL